MKLAITIALCLLFHGCITAQQWATVKAHSVEVGLAVVAGALSVVTGGTAGIAIAAGGGMSAALVGEIMAPKKHSELVVVQEQPPKSDGTPRPPVVHHYDETGKLLSSAEAQHDGNGNLKLPHSLDDVKKKVEEGVLDKFLHALGLLGWFVVLPFALVLAIGYVLGHPKLKKPFVVALKALGGAFVWAIGGLWRLCVKGYRAVTKRKASSP